MDNKELAKRLETIYESEGGYDEPVDIPLYHGTRQLGTPEEVAERGVKTFESEEEGRQAVIDALAYFGKEYMIDNPPRGWKLRSQTIHSLLQEIESPHRRKIWGSIYKDASHSWALRNPEIVTLALDTAGVSDEDIRKYLEEKYGKRYVVELKQRPLKRNIYSMATNINVGVESIPPEMIASVESVDEDIFLDKYRGQGWTRVGDLEDDEKALWDKMLNWKAGGYVLNELKFMGIHLRHKGDQVTHFSVE